MSNSYDLARDLTNEFFGNNLYIGGQYNYPEDNRPIEITGGQFMGMYGLSNFWYWKYLDEEGGEGHGYGGTWEEIT